MLLNYLELFFFPVRTEFSVHAKNCCMIIIFKTSLLFIYLSCLHSSKLSITDSINLKLRFSSIYNIKHD